ncbi:MAG: hypothetical protein ACRDQZ_02220 [Mycobacteriales bacterium]
MMDTTLTDSNPVAVAEAALWAELGAQALDRSRDLLARRATPNKDASSLALITTCVLEDGPNGVERGTDWTDHLLNALRLIASGDPAQ